jgi:hypothetical protein
MSWSKIVAGLTVVLFVFAIAMVDCAVAKEKKKATGTSVQVEFHPIKVDDEEGHIIAVFENKVVYTDSDTGEKSVGRTTGILDMNMKTGKGTMRGYAVRTFPNGDKYIGTWEGKPVGEGHTQGTYTIINGTGSLEGLKGEGTWDSRSLAQGVTFVEYEGVRVMPGQ